MTDLEFKRLLATQCVEQVAAMKAEKIIMKRPLIDLGQIVIDEENETIIFNDFREVQNQEGCGNGK